jgi:hypothetical protein
MENAPPEILALVFSYVTTKQLVLASCVCKTWRYCVGEYKIYRERITSKVPHLRSLNDEDILAQLAVAVDEKYLLLSGFCQNELPLIHTVLCQRGIQVDVYNTQQMQYDKNIATLPSFEILQEYKSVLIFNYSKSYFGKTEQLGELLAQYVEYGGGVVQCVYAICSNCKNGIPTGKFETHYTPIYYAKQDRFTEKTDLVKNIPDHFMLTGVNKFLRPETRGFCPTENGLRSTALTSVLASFNDKNSTYAVICREFQGRNKGKVCVLNFYPYYLDFDETNSPELITNALLFSGMVTNNK